MKTFRSIQKIVYFMKTFRKIKSLDGWIEYFLCSNIGPSVALYSLAGTCFVCFITTIIVNV